MDITGANYSNGTLIELWPCNGGANQQWQAENGELVNPASGKCLDDPDSNTTNGTQLDPVDLQRRQQPALDAALTSPAVPGGQPPRTRPAILRPPARSAYGLGSGARTMHRKPRWLVALSMACACRAAGR